MGKLMQMKQFEPYMNLSESERPQQARMSASHSKTFKAISLALRPCGVTAYEAAEQINSLGGQPYTPSYTKSAQFAPSYYSQLGYGAFGKTETVGEHLKAVRASQGDDEAEYVRSCLPQSMQDDDTEILVIYAYAAGGQAVGRYGQVVQDDLPESAQEAEARREALTRKRGGRQASNKKSSSRRKSS